MVDGDAQVPRIIGKIVVVDSKVETARLPDADGPSIVPDKERILITNSADQRRAGSTWNRAGRVTRGVALSCCAIATAWSPIDATRRREIQTLPTAYFDARVIPRHISRNDDLALAKSGRAAVCINGIAIGGPG